MSPKSSFVDKMTDVARTVATHGFDLKADSPGSELSKPTLEPLTSALEVWLESHWPGSALYQGDVFRPYTAYQYMQYVSKIHCYIDPSR